MDHFCYACFMFVFVMLSCLFLALLWSPAARTLTSWLSYLLCFLVFCHFSIWCSGSIMVLDCIDSKLCLPLSLVIFWITFATMHVCLFLELVDTQDYILC